MQSKHLKTRTDHSLHAQIIYDKTSTYCMQNYKPVWSIYSILL